MNWGERTALLSPLKILRFLARNRFARWAVEEYLTGNILPDRSGVTIRHRSKTMDYDLRFGDISTVWNLYELTDGALEEAKWSRRRGDPSPRPPALLDSPVWGFFVDIRW